MSSTIRVVRLSLIGVLLLPALAIGAANPAAITLERAAGTPMRYHLALPTGWKADHEWPVLVVIADSHRDFRDNLMRFVRERGSRPYILVAPEVLSCGGANSRTPDHYSLNRAEWDAAQSGDDFAFDDAGLAAVLADVHARWHGEARAFLTGWEAGGHTVWAQTLRRPERWRAVAPVTTNYQRRGVDPAAISSAPERTTLPIQVFRCGAPTGPMAGAIRFLDDQTENALRDAREHGFKPSAVRTVPGADHSPLVAPVMAWCDSVRQRR